MRNGGECSFHTEQTRWFLGFVFSSRTHTFRHSCGLPFALICLICIVMIRMYACKAAYLNELIDSSLFMRFLGVSETGRSSLIFPLPCLRQCCLYFSELFAIEVRVDLLLSSQIPICLFCPSQPIIHRSIPLSCSFYLSFHSTFHHWPVL